MVGGVCGGSGVSFFPFFWLIQFIFHSRYLFGEEGKAAAAVDTGAGSSGMIVCFGEKPKIPPP